MNRQVKTRSAFFALVEDAIQGALTHPSMWGSPTYFEATLWAYLHIWEALANSNRGSRVLFMLRLEHGSLLIIKKTRSSVL
jgi:hypothetical protein